MHREQCAGPFSSAIFAVVPVSNLICKNPSTHSQWTTDSLSQLNSNREEYIGRESKLTGIMRKEKGRGGGRMHEKEIKRGRINSEEEKQREQELGSGMN